MRGTGDRCNSKGIGFSSLVTGNDLKFQTNSYQSTKGNVLKVKTQLTYNNAYFNLQLVFITTQRTCKDVYLQVTTRQNNVLTTQRTYNNVYLQVTTRQNNVLTTQLTYNNAYLQVTTRQNNVTTYNTTYLQQCVLTSYNTSKQCTYNTTYLQQCVLTSYGGHFKDNYCLNEIDNNKQLF